jgi:predicted ribosome quality control (RQC) complex YloA/Tae2 family protein
MLLRKHLTSGKLIEIKQPSFERVLIFTFECQTELYETVKKNLIVEIMGRYSNIIFTDEKNIIYDAVKQIDFTTSTLRQILPGLIYELPPSQNKKELNESLSINDIDFTSGQRLDKYLTEYFIGFSPLISREIAFLSTGSTDFRLSDMKESQQEKLVFYLKKLCNNIVNEKYNPQLLIDNKPLEYYCIDIMQYGTGTVTKLYDSCSAVVDDFYIEKDRQEHIKRNSTDILKVLTTVSSRLSRKIETQRGELADCEKAIIYKKYGDLIIANIYKLSGREEKAVLTDYYSENQDEIEIPLNPSFSPTKNAQHYFKLYKKAETAKRFLNEQIPLAFVE